MRRLRAFFLLFLSTSLVAANPAMPNVSRADQAPEAFPFEEILEGMSMIEQYCLGVSTVDYAIAHLKAKGKGKKETAQTVARELIDKFPNESPQALQYMVGVLTYDVYEYLSLDLQTLMAWHFYTCMEGMSTGQGMRFADPRLKENLLQVIACEAPGENLYQCLAKTMRFDIPQELRNGGR